jgi:hypothetical protein
LERTKVVRQKRTGQAAEEIVQWAILRQDLSE